jgi:hypothetical protein
LSLQDNHRPAASLCKWQFHRDVVEWPAWNAGPPSPHLLPH